MTVALPPPRSPELLGTERPRRVSDLTVALQLAPGEARRLLLHPVFLLGFALTAVLVGAVADNGPRDAFDAASTGSVFYSGVPACFAANLLATRERRARAQELLAPLPGTVQQRTLALCLACLAPAAASLVLVLSVHGLLHLRDLYLVVPGWAHLAQGPLTVLGGALLGVLVGRWAPYPGAALVVMVAMVAWDVYASLRPDIALLGTFVSWATYGPGTGWYGLEPGSAAWHAAYLVGLCAMAVAGALLPGAARRGRVLAAGAALTALTAVPAVLQLP